MGQNASSSVRRVFNDYKWRYWRFGEKPLIYLFSYIIISLYIIYIYIGGKIEDRGFGI